LTTDSLLRRLPRVTAGAAARATACAAETAKHRRPNLLLVGGLTALAAIGYSVFSLLLQYTVRTHAYDLVIFDEAVRSYAHFKPGISPIKGLHNFGNADFSVLGDHWSPIIATLAPLYWIYNGPQDLLIAQAVLFALAIPPVWLFTRRAFGGGPHAAAQAGPHAAPARQKTATIAAYLVALTYGLSWPVQGAVGFDFHEVAFAPVLTAVGLERLQAGWRKTGLCALAGLFLVKEDMGIFVAGIGVALLISRRPWFDRQRLIAALMIPVGLSVSVTEVFVLIPAFGGRSNYYWAYGELGKNVRQAAESLVTHPFSGLHALITPGQKIDLLLWLLAPFLFLSVLSPLSIAAVPLLLERLLNVKFPAWWHTGNQYSAYLVIIILFAAVDGAVRLDGWLPRWRPHWRAGRIPLAASAVMAVVTLALVPVFPFGRLLHPAWYHRNKMQLDAIAAAAHVPSNVTVEAASNVAPQLTSRDAVLLWDGYGSSPEYPDWVVTSASYGEFSFYTIQDQIQRVKLLKARGYVTVWSRGGYLVMHKPGVSG
jgi:uncharacterized membrane protein